jgi:ABC-type nitrate/sulfonate/bicarbonate transport system substrate-binding protein
LFKTRNLVERFFNPTATRYDKLAANYFALIRPGSIRGVFWMYRLMVADVDSPSYFVATAAAELGFFKDEGVDLEFEFGYGASEGPERLRDGSLHFLGGPAFFATRAFPSWHGARLLCALSQYSYWFMAVRADLDIRRGDLAAVKGLRIAASPAFPEASLRYMLADGGIDLERDQVRIVQHTGTVADGHLKGWEGVDAIKAGTADGYWGNGMRLALGEKAGVAKVHLDLRRGDGPPGARYYNFAALTTTERLVNEHPDIAAGAVRAIVKTQQALKADPTLATTLGKRLFPPEEAELLGALIARDAPFYDAEITPQAIDGLNTFAKAMGLIAAPVPYDKLVATQYRELWKS